MNISMAAVAEYFDICRPSFDDLSIKVASTVCSDPTLQSPDGTPVAIDVMNSQARADTAVTTTVSIMRKYKSAKFIPHCLRGGSAFNAAGAAGFFICVARAAAIAALVLASPCVSGFFYLSSRGDATLRTCQDTSAIVSAAALHAQSEFEKTFSAADVIFMVIRTHSFRHG